MGYQRRPSRHSGGPTLNTDKLGQNSHQGKFTRVKRTKEVGLDSIFFLSKKVGPSTLIIGFHQPFGPYSPVQLEHSENKNLEGLKSVSNRYSIENNVFFDAIFFTNSTQNIKKCTFVGIFVCVVRRPIGLLV